MYVWFDLPSNLLGAQLRAGPAAGLLLILLIHGGADSHILSYKYSTLFTVMETPWDFFVLFFVLRPGGEGPAVETSYGLPERRD